MAEDKTEGTQGAFPLDFEDKKTGKHPDLGSIQRNTETGVLPAIDVVKDRERFFQGLKELLKLTSKSNKVERNQAYIEKAIEILVLPIWGDIPDKRNADFDDFNGEHIRNMQITGDDIGKNAREFYFTNSVALGLNAFRLADNGNISGSLIVGDHSLEGSGLGPKSEDFIERIMKSRGNTIENSVLFGEGVLKYAHDGEIKNSIIGGIMPATRALGLQLSNVYFVTPELTFQVKDHKLSGKGFRNVPISRIS